MSDQAGSSTFDPEDKWLAFASDDATSSVKVKRRRRFAVIAAFTVTIVVVSTLLITIGFGGTGPSAAAASAVRTATANTLADHSAAVTITGSITSSGQLIQMSGTGVLDFSNQLGDMTLSTASGTSPVVEHEVMTGSQMYLSMNAGGQSISDIVPGKSWVLYALPAVSSPSVGSGVGNPITQIQQLSARGNAVTALGAATINNVDVTGYLIVPDAAKIAQREKRYFKSSGLTGNQLNLAQQVAKVFGNLQIKIWVDSSNLVRRMTITAGGTVLGSAMSENFRMDFSDFGAPVTVVVPSSDQVVSFKNFQAALKQLNGGAG